MRTQRRYSHDAVSPRGDADDRQWAAVGAGAGIAAVASSRCSWRCRNAARAARREIPTVAPV
jgi:hypothetical protein